MRAKHKYRRVPIPPELAEVFNEQRERFKEKFGRYPGPQDPILWDEDADEPRPVSEENIAQILTTVLKQAGAPAEIIYAVEKTGRLVTEMNMHLLSKVEYQEWCDAIMEFRRLNPTS
jgi:hypothetical protein